MKLLVVSHACITPMNQGFFADVEQVTGWEVSLALPAAWDTEYRKGVAPTRWKDFMGAMHPVPVWGAGNIPLHLYKSLMVGLLKRERPDAIYVHHEPYGLATAQMYLANAMTGNCPIGFYAAQNILKNYPIPFRWFERMVYERSAFSFPVTEGACEVLRKKGYTGVAEVLPLAVDSSIYYARPEWAAAKRGELGIGEAEFVFGYLGRIVEEKGLDAMVWAFKLLGDRPWRCVVVGSGPYESKMRATLKELGIADRVMFAGFVPHEEAPGWLSLFDALVLASETRPNWAEQFGRVIVEANACGTPVIGTASGEIGKVLRGTSGGLVVPEADVTALSGAMASLVDDPARARALGAAGEAAVRTKYGQPVLAKRFAEVIEQAVARKGRD